MAAWQAIGDKLRQWFGPLFIETSYVARVYGDSLRDYFVGYTPTDVQKLWLLQAEFDAIMAKKRPYLADLLKVEVALLETMPDDVMRARFWAVRDRFNRVVPAGTRARYEAGTPPARSKEWAEGTFLRDQTLTLLDTIHANYLINIGREQSIKRLKMIIFSCFIAAILIAVGAIWSATRDIASWTTPPLIAGLTTLWAAGVTGAVLSIANRLQTAVSRDAMTEDGIFELTGLRVGWVGIVTSMILGGSFALVIYGVVMAGLLRVAYPEVESAEPLATAESSAQGLQNSDKIEEGLETVAGGDAAITDAAVEGVETGEDSVAAASAPSGTGTSKVSASSDIADVDAPRGRLCDESAAEKTCNSYGDRMARSLSLLNAESFFKMLILAFLAGFAERLVPDILSRLSKRAS